MLSICLNFTKDQALYAYKRYAYKKKTCSLLGRIKWLALGSCTEFIQNESGVF